MALNSFLVILTLWHWDGHLFQTEMVHRFQPEIFHPPQVPNDFQEVTKLF